MAGILEILWQIVLSSLHIGWPLLILALGLGGVAYFADKDKTKAAGGWAMAIVGILLFVQNLRR